MTEKKVHLVFDGDKLKLVTITSEKFEGMQVRMFFTEKKGRTSLSFFQWIGDYVPTDDPDWIPKRLFDPAIKQARAIFSDYSRRGEPRREQTSQEQTSQSKDFQARLIP